MFNLNENEINVKCSIECDQFDQNFEEKQNNTLLDDSSNVPFAKMFYCSTRICVVIDRCAVPKYKDKRNEIFGLKLIFAIVPVALEYSDTNLISMVVQMIYTKTRNMIIKIINHWQINFSTNECYLFVQMLLGKIRI